MEKMSQARGYMGSHVTLKKAHFRQFGGLTGGLSPPKNASLIYYKIIYLYTSVNITRKTTDNETKEFAFC